MTWVMVPIFRREHFRLAYYMKHYECIIPVLFMLADLTWIATSSLHGIYNYDIIVSNAARDRHEEYDQFLRFRSHQWYVTEGLREAHKRPRKDIYELYVEMEKKEEESRGIKRPCAD